MADIKKPSLVSGGDYGSIGKGGGGGLDKSNTVKIALVVVLFLAAGLLLAWNFHVLPSFGSKKKTQQAVQLKPEDQRAAKEQQEQRTKLEEDPEIIIGGQ